MGEVAYTIAPDVLKVLLNVHAPTSSNTAKDAAS